MLDTRKNQSLILNYIQRSTRLGNDAMAKILGFKTTKTWIRLKTGRTPISLFSTQILQKQFQIELVDIFKGEVSANPDNPRFFLPEKYCEYTGSSGFLTNIYINYFISKLGEEYFKEFCRCEGVDRYYFINTANKVSIIFIRRMLQELAYRRAWNYADLARYLAPRVKKSSPTQKNFWDLVNLDVSMYFEKFEKNHYFCKEEITKSGIVVSFSPRREVGNLYKNDLLLGNTGELMIVNNIARTFDAKFNLLESMSKGSSKCVALLAQ